MIDWLRDVVAFYTVLLLLPAVGAMLALVWRWRLLQRQPPLSDPSSASVRIVILLPALREQPIVGQTLAWFLAMLKSSPDDRAIVITTEKEEYQAKALGTTGATTRYVVQEHLEAPAGQVSGPRISHLHYPGIAGTKATQLNYALAHLSDEAVGVASSACYVGVYDFDSRPDLSTLLEVREATLRGRHPAVLQQVPVPSLNWAERGATLRGAPVVCHGVMHVVRSLGIELLRGLYAEAGVNPARYCMGAGLFVRLDVLRRFGGFPEVNDDIPLGFRYTIHGQSFRPLLRMNEVELPETLRQVVNQHVLILRGVLEFVQEIGRGLKHGGRPSGMVKVAIEGINSTVECLLYPYLIMAYVVALALSGGLRHGPGVVLVGAMGEPYVTATVGIASMLLLARGHRRIRWETACIAFLLAPAYRVWRTLGGWIYLWRALRAKLLGGGVEYSKTERVGGD